MVEVKPVVKKSVNENVILEPRKVQFYAKLVVEKPFDDTVDKKQITFYMNPEMEIVFFAEIFPDEIFLRMVDQMLSSVFTSTTHKSGWMLQQFNAVEVPLVSLLPMSESS